MTDENKQDVHAELMRLVGAFGDAYASKMATGSSAAYDAVDAYARALTGRIVELEERYAKREAEAHELSEQLIKCRRECEAVGAGGVGAMMPAVARPLEVAASVTDAEVGNSLQSWYAERMRAALARLAASRAPVALPAEPEHWATLRAKGWTLHDCRICGESASSMKSPAPTAQAERPAPAVVEPVAWIDTRDLAIMKDKGRGGIVWHRRQDGYEQTPLYTAPQPHQIAEPASDLYQEAASRLADLIDIWDDRENNAPEHRCYVPEALGDTLAEARIILSQIKSIEATTPKEQS